MKFINKKILFAITALFTVALMPFIQSCSSNNEFDDTEKIQNNVELSASEKNEIINSTEFKDFVDANIEIAAIVKQLTEAQQTSSKTKATAGIMTNSKSNKSYKCEYDYEKIKIIIGKVKAFKEKFPFFEKASKNNTKKLIIESIINSKELCQKIVTIGLVSKKITNTRLKTPPENYNFLNGGEYGFWNLNSALEHCTIWGYITNKECAGFILDTGEVVVCFDWNSTNDTSRYPVGGQAYPEYGVAFYNGHFVVATFHIHFNSSQPSNPYNTSQINGVSDISTQQTYFPNMPMMIYYQGQSYWYSPSGYPIP